MRKLKTYLCGCSLKEREGSMCDDEEVVAVLGRGQHEGLHGCVLESFTGERRKRGRCHYQFFDLVLKSGNGYLLGANAGYDTKLEETWQRTPMLRPQSHSQTGMHLQERNILYHCNSLKRNSEHSRAFWSLLISLSHPSHPSALPLTSLTASLNLSCTLFHHSVY